jgi:hypothetical protein
LQDRLAERQHCALTNQQTGRVDTLLRYQLANGEDDLKNLEKLAYTYERGGADDQLSSGERAKRVQQMGEQRQKLGKVMIQAKQALGMDVREKATFLSRPEDQEAQR